MKENLIKIPFIILKGFVSSIKELVWTISGIFLLNMLLLNYLNNDFPITISNNFLEITQILSKNIIWFFFIFWFCFSLFEIIDLLKDFKKELEKGE